MIFLTIFWIVEHLISIYYMVSYSISTSFHIYKHRDLRKYSFVIISQEYSKNFLAKIKFTGKIWILLNESYYFQKRRKP